MQLPFQYILESRALSINKYTILNVIKNVQQFNKIIIVLVPCQENELDRRHCWKF